MATRPARKRSPGTVSDKQSPTPVGSIANQSNVEGSTIDDLDVAGNFSDDDTLTFSASGLPAGLSISAAGVISGTIAADAQGVYSVAVTADDGDETTTQIFSWTVSDKQSPTSVAVDNQSNVEGSTITDLDVAGNFNDDDTLTFSASGLPTGLSINAAGVISGTIAADAQGVYSVTVTADDGDETTTQIFSWTVSDKQSPTSVAVDNQSNVEGSTITDLDVTGNFDDDDTLTFSTSGLPTGLSINAAGVISGTIAADAQGVYGVTVTADDGDETSTQTFSLDG